MNKFLIFLLVFKSVLYCVRSQTPPVSPCPDIYHYETDGIVWSGIIEAPSPPPYGSEMTLKVRMSIKASLPNDYLGKIELAEGRGVVLQRIHRGWPVKYKVFFPLSDPIPSIVNIVFAGRQICSGPPVTGRIVTAIDLQHTLHSGNSAIKNSPKNQLIFSDPAITFPEDEEDIFDPHRKQPPAVIENRHVFEGDEINTNPDTDTVFDEHGICGTTGVSSIPLIVTGETVTKGDWPWLTAIFIKKSRGLEFICAGSLISDQIVITAAHCMKRTSNKPATKPEDVVLKLGVQNLQDWTETTAVTKDVAKIKIHEDFNEGLILNADIAMLFLRTPIKFTEFIRPVCLWAGDNSLNRIVGEMGMVIGWGRDEKGSIITPEPKVAAVPIVSTTTCRASRKEFFHLTSDRTLCAGGRDGSGPCNGDSGGGLYIKQGSKWTLRGIVSNSLRNSETNSCDLREFVVYTDAAKYSSWMREP